MSKPNYKIMCIYSCLSNKGGAGKSLTTVQLALWLHRNDFSVAIIDNDIQRSTSDWLEDHPANITVVNTSTHVEMEKTMYELQESYDVVLIDNCGGDVVANNVTMQASDHVLIPLRASAVDINSTFNTIEELKLARKRARRPIPATIFLNAVTKGTKIIKEVREVFADVSDIDISSIEIPQTVRLAALSGDGESVFDRKSNADLAKLYSQLFDSILS